MRLLSKSRGGESYTLGEYEQMFRTAGLARPERHYLVPAEHSLLVARTGGER